MTRMLTVMDELKELTEYVEENAPLGLFCSCSLVGASVLLRFTIVYNLKVLGLTIRVNCSDPDNSTLWGIY